MQYNMSSQIKNIPKQSNQGISSQTEDQLRPFRVSDMIDKQVDIEKLAPEQLIKYCHSQWTEWMKHILQLQQCIKQQQEQAHRIQINKISPINITQAKIEDQINKQPHLRQNNTPIQEYNIPRQTMYPPSFLGKDFDTVMRSQNSFPIPPTNLKPGPFNPPGMQVKPTQSLSHPQFLQNPSQMNQLKSPFPFPFAQDKQMTQGFPIMGFQHPSYNQNIKRQFPDQEKGQNSKNNDKQHQQKQ